MAAQKALGIGFKKLRCKEAILEVRPDNKRAIKTYEACGFKKIKFSKNGKYIKMSLAKKDFLIKF